MRIDRRLKAVRKLPAHPQVIVGARAKSRFRKHIGIIWNAIYAKKEESGNSREEPKADLTPNYNFRPIGASKKPTNPICSECKPSLINPVADQ